MILYAETSAVLAWLLGESTGQSVRAGLAGAAAVFTSQLTLAECERALARLAASRHLDSTALVVLRETLGRAAAHWIRLEISSTVLGRCGEPFPVEPVRTLDAIHLATALELRAAEPRLVVLSLDERVRRNASAMGLVIQPAAGPA
ncbi:MAG: type II toxin-antitoxin system VapC family toxin [Gemmatimonadales bacterium]